MKRRQITQIFRLYNYDNASDEDGFNPDLFKTKDFKVFTEALAEAQKLSEVSQIEAVAVYNKHPFEIVTDKWEVNINEYYLV